MHYLITYYENSIKTLKENKDNKESFKEQKKTPVNNIDRKIKTEKVKDNIENTDYLLFISY